MITLSKLCQFINEKCIRFYLFGTVIKAKRDEIERSNASHSYDLTDSQDMLKSDFDVATFYKKEVRKTFARYKNFIYQGITGMSQEVCPGEASPGTQWAVEETL